MPIRILAVADEIDEALYGPRLAELRPDLILGCGDLPFDYLEYLTEATSAPLYYVRGNHDPGIERPSVSAYLPAEYHSEAPARVLGGIDVDGRVADQGGLRIAGLGGSIRYRDGPNQYTQREMGRRVRKLVRSARLRRVRDGRAVDVVIAHSPPLDNGDADDPAHRGFSAFHRLIDHLRPRLMLHGHIHPHGFPTADRTVGDTRIVNVIPYRLLEIEL
jgi:predicted phosphohydrolase